MDLFFGKNLRFLRKSKLLTQVQLDDALGLGKNITTNYELDRNNPTLETLVKIADYFGVTIDALLRIDMSEVGIGASLPAISADKEIEYLKEALKDKEEIIYHLKKRLND